MTKIFKISRPILWLNTLGPAWVGLWLTGTLWTPEFLIFLIWLTLPFNLLIYGINDISDLDTDLSNERKGGWEGARIRSEEFVWIFSWIAVLNLPFLIYFTLALSQAAGAVVAAYILLFIFYSLPPRLKSRVFLDSLSNAAYALPLVFIPLAMGSQVNWNAALGLMSWSVAKHCYDSIQDIHADQGAGLRTTAVVLGRGRALLFSWFFWLLSSVFFSSLSPSLGVLNIVYASTLVGVILKDGGRQKERLLYRFSVLYPYVVGTYGGVLLASAVYSGLWKV